MKSEDIIKKIDISRISDDLWCLLKIPSPTGNERKAALRFAEMLSTTGSVIEVELDETIFNSPCVIGRLRGNRPGKILQLAGHIDHIDVGHPEPERNGRVISGRGSCDMKYGLAGILELVRILQENNCDFPGEILVTIYGLHEEPKGHTKGIMTLIDKGIKGDAAIVMEGPSDVAIVMNMGLARWDVVITQKGLVCHETVATKGRDDLLKTVLNVVNLLVEKNNDLRKKYKSYGLINRPESLFIGQIHYGDFFNRVPNECRLQGTVRWHPNRSFAEIEEEMKNIFHSIEYQPEINIEYDLTFIGHSYEIDLEEPIVLSLLNSYKAIHKNELKIEGQTCVTDAQRLIKEGGVPAIIWGANLENAHKDYEFVELDKVHKVNQMIFHAAMDYLNNSADFEK